MLKNRQIKKLILDALSGDQPTFAYLGFARGKHYLRHLVDNPTEPKHNVLALSLDQDAAVLRSGSSFFATVAEIAVAPSFTRWSQNEKRRDYSSKQTAKRAIGGLIESLRTDASFASTYVALRDERQLRSVHLFFESARRSLADAESPQREKLKQVATPQLYQEILTLAALGDNAPEDEALDALLLSLGQDGSYESSAGFTLNRDEALRKLTDYQLGDPVLFPLFLAVGLTLAKASRISIEVDSDETWVRFEGASLPSSFLEAIPNHLLSSGEGTQGLALQALGRALLQGAGNDPLALQLEAASGIIDLRKFPEDFATVDWNETSAAGTFYRRQRFGFNVASRFLKSRAAPHSEVPELLEALEFLPIPWTVNGTQRSGKLESPDNTLTVLWQYSGSPLPEIIGSPELRVQHQSPVPASVLFRFHPDLPAKITAVQHGMQVALPEDGPFRPTVSVILWLPEMATDLSARRIVGSVLLEEILSSLSDLEARAWKAMLERFDSWPQATRRSWIGPLLNIASQPQQRQTIENLQLLPCVGQPDITLTHWKSGKRHLYCSESENFSHPLLTGEPVVFTHPNWEKSLLSLVGDPFDASHELTHTARYHQKLAAWLALPTVTLTLPDDALSELSLRLPEDQGHLFMTTLKTPKNLLLVDGRPLPWQPQPEWAPPFVGYHLKADGLRMDWNWRGVEPPEKLVALKDLLLSQLSKLADTVARVERLSEGGLWEPFCYLLAFLKVRGVNIRRWTEQPLLTQEKGPALSLDQRLHMLEPYLRELA